MPVKPIRKPLPWWLVTILALIAVAVAAFIFNTVMSSGHHHEGMPETTNAAALAGDDWRGVCADCPPPI